MNKYEETVVHQWFINDMHWFIDDYSLVTMLHYGVLFTRVTGICACINTFGFVRPASYSKSRSLSGSKDCRSWFMKHSRITSRFHNKVSICIHSKTIAYTSAREIWISSVHVGTRATICVERRFCPFLSRCRRWRKHGDVRNWLVIHGISGDLVFPGLRGMKWLSLLGMVETCWNHEPNAYTFAYCIYLLV